MEPRMNTAMRNLIETLAARNIDVEYERDNCITVKHYIQVNEAEKAPDKVIIVTPYKAVGGVEYYLTRTNKNQTLTRMSKIKVVDMITNFMKEEA